MDKWTKEKPTKPGFYWLKHKGWCGVVQIVKDYDSVLTPGSDEDSDIGGIVAEGGLWADPLYPPEPN